MPELDRRKDIPRGLADLLRLPERNDEAVARDPRGPRSCVGFAMRFSQACRQAIGSKTFARSLTEALLGSLRSPIMTAVSALASYAPSVDPT